MVKEIKLGNKVKCIITNFQGIVTAKCEYINGCVQYLVKPKIEKDRKYPQGTWIDRAQLKVIPGGISIKKTMGGSMDDTPSVN